MNYSNNLYDFLVFILDNSYFKSGDSYNYKDNPNSMNKIADAFNDIDIFNQDMNIWAVKLFELY
jgi:hypothetical protein